ncbi:MAG: hypothetical protein ICV79_23830, partial [Flavisolibacter sp.]|nr:hypothetical protein [Flavisolibacter sp.]
MKQKLILCVLPSFIQSCILLLFLSIALISYSQRAVTFSVKPAYSFTRVIKEIKENMIESGFDDTSPPGWFSDKSIAHPKTFRLGVGFLAELELLTQKRLSYSIAGGLSDWGEVDGYDNIGIGNYLFLKYSTWIITPGLTYHYASHRATFGPAIAFFKYKDMGAEQGALVDETKMVGGISISNNFFTQKKRKLKTGLFVQANLFPAIKT